jgi:putative MATE family efflux protein
MNEAQAAEQLKPPVANGAESVESLFSDESPTSRQLIRRVLGLTWPVLVENFLQTMVGVVDTFMVSFLGTVALAGVGTSLPLVFVIFSAISAIGIGGTVLVAHAVGAKDLNTAAKAAKQALLLGILASIVLTSIGVPLARPIVGVLGPEERVLDIGSEYFSITMAASVGLVFMFVVGAVLRGAGDTRTPMVAGLAANVVNILLAYVLIFGNAGFPEMGPVGSAWAGAIARLVGAGGLLVVLWRGRNGVSIRGMSDWMLDRAMSARFLRIGLPFP